MASGNKPINKQNVQLRDHQKKNAARTEVRAAFVLCFLKYPVLVHRVSIGVHFNNIIAQFFHTV